MGAVLHHVRLADLNSLAEIWEMPGEYLGLEINANGELSPILIDSLDDGIASLAEMRELAKKNFPRDHALNIIVSVHETSTGNKVAVSTIDHAFSALGKATDSRWWTFTDEYIDLMH